MRFYFEESQWDGWNTIQFGDHLKSQHLHMALRGATLLDYQIIHQGKHLSICDGFASGEELKLQGSARFFIMAPFANRIPDGKYQFNGKSYILKPSNPFYQKVRHGLAKDLDFQVNKIIQDESTLMIQLVNKDIKPGKFEGYPFELDLTIKLILSDLGLEVKVTGTNCGNEPLPFYSGWHSYFKTSDKGINHCQLIIPAQKLIRTDENDIPIDGYKCLEPLDSYPELDFRPDKAALINNRILDHGYAACISDSDGNFRSSLIDQDSGLKINVFQDKGTVIAFSGDTITYRPRTSMAIEPVQCLTNAFNRLDSQEEITVNPGESKSFAFGIEHLSLI